MLDDCLAAGKTILDDDDTATIPWRQETKQDDGLVLAENHHKDEDDTDAYKLSFIRNASSHNFVDATTDHPSFSPSNFIFQEEREQALRDYKVTIEYKHLKSHAPGGVYLVPSLQDLRHFYGVIFVRRGLYHNGIFKFQIHLPLPYNSVNTWPQVTFTSYVYNPHVTANGELDVRTAYPQWDPSRHYLVTILTFLKKIFYAKAFDDAKANDEAKTLFQSNAEGYRKAVEACVSESQKNVFVNEPDCTTKFTEEQVAHGVLRDLLKRQISNPNQVTKDVILALVEKANQA
jgi:ubiquitin-protein ligase